MLEIDYNLLPLSEEENAQIAARAFALARRGKTPPISPASYGRVVVINPYEGFTLHHVPDDLRRPLRRAMVSLYDASKLQSGSQLADQILESSDEPIYHIVLELHSDFPGIVSFFEQMPRIRRRHPYCRLLIHGNMMRVHDFLTSLLEQGGTSCELHFQHVEEGILLEDKEGLEALLLELPRYPAYPNPFFSTLRIRAGGSAADYDISTMKKLYPFFGVGHIEELDLSGKLREKLIVLDIPVSAIEFIRFSKERGEAFRGVRLGGELVTTENFREAGLEERDIPFSMVQAIYRQLPGRGEDEILIDRVRALRVNCFDGHISFLWKPRAAYVPLYEVRGMRLHLNSGNGGGLEELEADSGGAGTVVSIDSAVITERGQPRFGDVRAAVRRDFLRHIFEENLGRQAKLQRYAEKLKIACLGPMAAQAIKLMRPYGLDQLIPEESLYYLCDSYRQIPEYPKTQQRVERLFDSALKSLKELFGNEESAGVKTGLITHRLPLINEWVRGETPLLKDAGAEQLDTIYKEIRIFLGFAESELQRLDRTPEASNLFFARLEECRGLSLRVRHLANLIGGQYGRLPTRDSFPDFVFFGTDADMLENRQEFYLPGLALSTLFKGKENQALFHTEDFEFGVFLKEQLAILAYVQSQEMGKASETEFQDNYFDERIAETEREIEKLEETSQTAEAPPAEETITGMTEAHRSEAEAFRNDRDLQAEKLQTQEDDYFQALKAVNAYLRDEGSEADLLLAGDDYIGTLDRQLVKKSQGFLAEMRSLVKANLGAANALIKQKRDQLTAFLKAFTRMQKAMFAHLQAEYVWELHKGYEKALPGLLDTLNTIARTAAKELPAVGENLARRKKLAGEELAGLEGELNRGVEKNQQTMVAIRENHRGLASDLAKPLHSETGDGAPGEVLGAIESRLKNAEESLQKMATAAETSRETVENLRTLYRRKSAVTLSAYACRNEQVMLERGKERSRLQRMMGSRIAEPPIPVTGLDKRQDPARLVEEKEKFTSEWRSASKTLLDFGQRAEEIESVRTTLGEYQNFQQVYGSFRSAVRRKMLGQHAMGNINARIALLEKETENLEAFIHEHMVPAHAEFARRVHLPESRKRVEFFHRAKAFVGEVRGIKFEELQREFLDRGIFRRFHAAQFVQGGYFGLNPDLPVFAKLGNLMQGIFLFHRSLAQALGKTGVPADDVRLTKLPSERPPGIIQFIEEQHQLRSEHRFAYLVLPGTLSFSQALEIIQHKENVFSGLPQLILIYISKFDSTLVREDSDLRERYFNAVKHNVIINIDEFQVVDNPKAIGERLLQDTLGCAHDFKASDLGVESGPSSGAA